MIGYSPLATERITAIMRELEQEDDRDGGRLFDSWVPAVPASDGEIMLHISGDVVAADIIQMDQAAVIRAPEPMRTTQVAIPKLKHGHLISEAMIELFSRISQNFATTRDRSVFDNYVAGRLRWLLAGIRDRRELILAGMLIDDFDYNRFGIIMSNVTWGKPSALKSTVTVWSNTGAATPLADIEGMIETAEDDYGKMYDTVVLTRQGLAEMMATDEFTDRAEAWIRMQLAGGTLPAGTEATTRGEGQLRGEQILTRSLRRPIRFIVYNKRTKLEAGDGSKSTAQFLPDDKVLLLDSGDLGDAMTWDFGNAVVVETMPGMVPQLIDGDFEGEQEGPVAYATGGDPQGNPPGQVLWACQRGWPRLHDEAANAVLTI